jgi:gamma-glutamyltranspeptidase
MLGIPPLMCAQDEDRVQARSMIITRYGIVASGLVAGGAGFALQNRGALISLAPDSPNVLASHKRPLHTIIPAFMSNGSARLAFGIMGGWNQAQAHAQLCPISLTTTSTFRRHWKRRASRN